MARPSRAEASDGSDGIVEEKAKIWGLASEAEAMAAVAAALQHWWHLRQRLRRRILAACARLGEVGHRAEEGRLGDE